MGATVSRFSGSSPFTNPPIGYALALDTLEGFGGALMIRDLAGVVTEVELAEISLEVEAGPCQRPMAMTWASPGKRPTRPGAALGSSGARPLFSSRATRYARRSGARASHDP